MDFLVIDDDELSRELVAMLLGVDGHSVKAAASGEEAIQMLSDRSAENKLTPAVILSDLQMPGISGAALAIELRAALDGQTRLIAMSGSQPIGQALEGFDGFLLKPFSMSDLEAVLTPARFSASPAGAVAGEGLEDAPALNEEIYAKMAEMMPGAQLGEMYAMCLADARKRLGQMVQLAEAGDDEGYRRAAHTVKGGCGMIGATELYQLAEAAERDGLGSETSAGSTEVIGTSAVTTLLRRFYYACDRLERILTTQS